MDENKLKGHDLLTLRNYSSEDIKQIIDLAIEQKKELKEKGFHAHRPLQNKSVAMYFEKQSLRTRVSFEVGIAQLGGQPIFIHSSATHSKRGEPIKDMSRVLARYVDGIVFRANRHEDIVQMAEFSSVPIINALCDQAHPCQALTDLMTIFEHKGRKHVKVAYIGDAANNVALSLITVFSKTGIDLSLGCPAGYRPPEALLNEANENCGKSGSMIEIFEDPIAAVRDADIIYTDVWVSMGDEEEAEKRFRDFEGYMITNDMLKAAGKDVLFMHDMPAHRGEEVHEDVIDGARSIVIDQAENRLHAQKAVMTLLIGD
ncbi:MAG TPA: ornithine carbamoyltransferase [bacterium]|nr:ornithine carbamoyltransferase [bacterium]